MALRGTDPESYITEYALVYENHESVCIVDLGVCGIDRGRAS